MLDTILIILLAIACYSAGLIVNKKWQPTMLDPYSQSRQPSKQALSENGCAHKSSSKLKVTSMGDSGDWYLCSKCGEKIPASKLVEFE